MAKKNGKPSKHRIPAPKPGKPVEKTPHDENDRMLGSPQKCDCEKECKKVMKTVMNEAFT
jgi:hypothetical protein